MNETLGKIWTEAGVLARKARAQAKPVSKALVGNARASWKYGVGGAVAAGGYGYLSSDRNSTGREQMMRGLGYAAGGAALGTGIGTAIKSAPGFWIGSKEAFGELKASYGRVRPPSVSRSNWSAGPANIRAARSGLESKLNDFPMDTGLFPDLRKPHVTGGAFAPGGSTGARKYASSGGWTQAA